MAFITLDFETYYSKDVGFSKQTTEEYLHDPAFHVIGVAIKVEDGEPEWVVGTPGAIEAAFAKIDWESSAVLCHNALFDCAILAWHYGIKPAYIVDTLCMARAIHGVDAGGSLAKLAERYSLGEKGSEVVNALGKRLQDFSPEELERYGEYCINDVNLTVKLYNRLANKLSISEYDLIDMTVRMFTEPKLRLNDALLIERLDEVREEKRGLLADLMGTLNCDDEESVRVLLASNKKFAALLQLRGVEVPLKVSPATGKDTYALAKNDEGFIALTEHEDPIVQQLCAVRLGTKSTIEESRIERFIGIGERNKGFLPIPLKYYGAHTGRWSGQDGINMQNLPSRDKKKKALKNAIVAPDGYYVVNCDSSQIEARVLAWWADQWDVVQQFANGEDVYSTFASKIYGRPISKANPVERFVGKTCLGAETRVLTRRGWVAILDVQVNDQLWDGVEWVSHQGVSYMGQKQTINLRGLKVTPDHEILTAPTKWESAQTVLLNDPAFQSALDLANLSLSDMGNTYPAKVNGFGVGTPSAGVSVVTANTLTQNTTYEQEGLPPVIHALNVKQMKNGIGNIKQPYPTIPTGLACSTDFPQQSLDVIPLVIDTTSTTESGVFTFMRGGVKTAQRFFSTCKRWMGGTFRNMTWTGLTTTTITSPETSVSCHAVLTPTTREKSKTLKPVYDILNSGSRNRFTVLTNDGPLIVHNCVLGLGYGTGAEKLRHTLKTSPPGADLPLATCKSYVDLYRDVNYKIVGLWHECDAALHSMMGKVNKPFNLGISDCVMVDLDGISLPNRLYIRYPKLRLNEEGRMIYDSRRGPVNIWGGAMVENVVQALARIIVGQQMISLRHKGYTPILTVHDAAVCLVPKDNIEQALADITNIMSTPPQWATGLPVACEAKYGESYGEC